MIRPMVVLNTKLIAVSMFFVALFSNLPFCDAQEGEILHERFGGNGGEAFEMQEPKSIGMRQGDRIDGLILNSELFGGEGGVLIESKRLKGDDYWTKVEIWSGEEIDGLIFTSKNGKVVGSYDGDGGSKTVLNNIRVVKVGGRAGNSLDAINIDYIELSDESGDPDACCILVMGGSGGDKFRMRRPKSINIRQGDRIDALIINGKQYGGSGGDKTGFVRLKDGDYWNKVEIWSGEEIDGLIFTSKDGKVAGGYDGDGGHKTVLKDIRVTRIGGRAGNRLDRIAIEYIPESDPFVGSVSDLAKEFAPRVWMHSEEKWFPSSVKFFERKVTNEGDYYKTKQDLPEPSTWNWDGAFGQNPEEHEVPVYAFVTEGKREEFGAIRFTDVSYFMFYPYNRGKGFPTVYGNHIGDWEHLTVRFCRIDDGYYPVKVSLSSHDAGIIRGWNSKDLRKIDDTHVVAFEAHGSHGLYNEEGDFDYGPLDVLTDETDKGIAWDTWNKVTTVTYNGSEFECVGHNGRDDAEECSRWLNYAEDFRWGNKERGAEAFGAHQLENGPTGPATKPAITDLGTFD